jgi:hypothetical protein
MWKRAPSTSCQVSGQVKLMVKMLIIHYMAILLGSRSRCAVRLRLFEKQYKAAQGLLERCLRGWLLMLLTCVRITSLHHVLSQSGQPSWGLAAKATHSTCKQLTSAAVSFLLFAPCCLHNVHVM